MKGFVDTVREIVGEHYELLIAMLFVGIGAYCITATSPRYKEEIASQFILVSFKGHDYVVYPGVGFIHSEDCGCTLATATRVLSEDHMREMESLKQENARLKSEKE